MQNVASTYTVILDRLARRQFSPDAVTMFLFIAFDDARPDGGSVSV